ncbi:hypothetical protein TRVL_06655 [Trypanosoma vivax]|nr:hypothetical protein TRVL_06655 [Trypanosoma vivax]
MQMYRFSDIASAKELSASDTARALPYEMQRSSRSHAPPAAHTSPLSLNRSAPHPHMEASVANVADVGRCLRGAAGLFSSNVLGQRFALSTFMRWLARGAVKLQESSVKF